MVGIGGNLDFGWSRKGGREFFVIYTKSVHEIVFQMGICHLFEYFRFNTNLGFQAAQCDVYLQFEKRYAMKVERERKY